MRNIMFLENRSELGAGTRGSSLGVEALKMAAIVKGSRLFHDTPRRIIQDMNEELLVRPVLYPFAKKIDAMVEMYQRISQAIQETLQAGAFPFILSGDHSNAGGTIAGIKTAYPDKKLGVIWIDAHADMHSPYTTPSGNLHGMPLAASLAFRNSDSDINQPDDATRISWDKLCALGNIIPKIYPEDLVLIDIRDLEPEEWSSIRKHNVKYYEPHDVKAKGIARIIQETNEHLSACDLIYVSFDVDSMDPTVSVGTGTPVAHGLKAEQAMELLSGFWRNPKLACMEITEINPLLDTHNLMAETVVEFIENLTA
jgi:arginase